MPAAAKKTPEPVGTQKGRPRLYATGEEPEIVPTRIPADFHPVLKYLTVLPNAKGETYGTEIRMYEAMLQRFIEERPFEGKGKGGFTWQTCGSLVVADLNGQKSRTKWKQLNVQMKPTLRKTIERLAIMEGQSVAALLYSALYWWVYTVNRVPPPPQLPEAA